LREAAKRLCSLLSALKLSRLPPALFQEGSEQAVSRSPELQKIFSLAKDTMDNQRSIQSFGLLCDEIARASHGCSDEAFLILCRAMVTKALSTARCTCFTRRVILPRIKSLPKTVSRVLFMALAHVSSLHPGPVTKGLLVPIIEFDKVSAVHSDIIRRLVQGHSKSPVYAELVRDLMQSLADAPGSSAHVSKSSTEARATVMQELLSKIPPSYMNLACGKSVLDWASGAVQAFPKSLKVANVLFRFVQHKSVARQLKSELSEILLGVQSFMKKTITNKIAKLPSD